MTRIGVRYRTLRLCSGGGGFEAIPETSQRLDLPSIRQRLEAEGSSVTDARVMLIIAGTPEVTISSAGRVLIKSSDRSLAERAFERIRPLLGPPS